MVDYLATAKMPPLCPTTTDQLLNGRLRSTTVLNKRAPEEVLLAVLGAHSSLPRTEITRKRNPEELYVAYCQNALPLTQSVNDSTLVHLAWDVREQQQSREGHFLPHAQRYLEELKDLLCGTPSF